MIYEFRISRYYRENTKWNQQFCTILHTKAPKTGKKSEVESAIPKKYEIRLLIVRCLNYEVPN